MSDASKIQLNCLVMWLDTQVCERILCWHIPNETYYVINTEGPAWPEVRTKEELDNALGEERRAVILEQDHLVMSLRRLELLTEKQRLMQDKAWALIKELVEDKARRVLDRRLSGRLIAETAKRHGVDHTSVRKHLRRYWQRGQLEASVQSDFHKCGAAGKPRLDAKEKLGNLDINGMRVGIHSSAKVRAQFKEAIDKHYNKEDRLPLSQVFLKLLIKHYLKGFKVVDGKQSPELLPENERPTFRQFRHYFDFYVRKVDSMRKRFGDRRFDQNYRGSTGDQSKTARGIGDIYQIDATTADVYLALSVNTGLTVKRPVVYLVIDVFSGLIAGFHVTYSNMHYNQAAMAIWNAYRDKVEFCEKELGRSGISLEKWPARGLPNMLLADRGELLSKASDGPIQQLGIEIDNAPAYSPTTKAFVERHFGLRNSELIKWLPGAVPDSNADKAGKESHLKRASVTLVEFMDALVDRILAFNECVREDYQLTPAMMSAGVEKRPYKIWEWGAKHANFLRDMDARQVRVGLLPSADGLVKDDGMNFRGLTFTCNTAEKDEWFSSPKAKSGKWKVRCAYDPGCVDRIFLLGKSLGEFEVCQLTERHSSFTGWTWAHYDLHAKLEQKLLLAQKKGDLEVQVRAQFHMDQLRSEAKKRRDEFGPSNVKHMTAAKMYEEARQAQQETEEINKLLGVKPVAPAEAAQPISKVTEEWLNQIEEEETQEAK